MTIVILVIEEHGSQQAIAAFGSNEKAEQYVLQEKIPKPEFVYHEVTEKVSADPERIYIAHKALSGHAQFISGIFLNRFEAQLSFSETDDGFVRLLEIDEPNKEEIDAVLDRAEKEAQPSAAQKAKPQVTLPPFGKKSWVDKFGGKNHFIALVSLTLFYIVLNVLYLIRSRHVEFAEHVASVEWLPEEASDISYYIDRKFRAFEFSISEQGFKEWAESQSFSVGELTDDPVNVTRYTFDSNKPVPGIESMNEQEQFEAWELYTKASISQGYVLKEYNRAGDLTLAGGFDNEIGRAYYRGRNQKNRR